MQYDLLETLVTLAREGIPCVTATVVGSSGSSPRKAGARLVLAADGRLFGTVGGGGVEARVLEAAKEVLEGGEPRLLQFDLRGDGKSMEGMICGGTMEVFLEPVRIAST